MDEKCFPVYLGESSGTSKAAPEENLVRAVSRALHALRALSSRGYESADRLALSLRAIARLMSPSPPAVDPSRRRRLCLEALRNLRAAKRKLECAGEEGSDASSLLLKRVVEDLDPLLGSLLKRCKDNDSNQEGMKPLFLEAMASLLAAEYYCRSKPGLSR